MPLPDSFIEDIKDRNDIADIASSYVTLKRHGRNLTALCPFHNEKTPSFNIYTDSRSFYCFGCGVGGDVITFIRLIENLDYIEAVKFLAQRCGLKMPENDFDDSASKIKNRIYEANREAARYFHKMLYSNEGAHALEYLRKRGLTEHTIKHFGLGYCPASRFSLVNHLRYLGYKNEELINANLAFKGKSGGCIDRFYNRVMFPIIDLRGNVIAFGGRTLTDEKPKYLNTSDTLVFKKTQSLFALNFAKKTCSDRIILTEGYMDVISLHQAGFENTIATLGTSITKEQANLISRYTNEVVICYDSDSAGQKATNRAINLLRETGLLIKVITIPQGKDPDEFIKSYGNFGAIKFKQLIESSNNDIEYSLNKLKLSCDIDTTEGKVQYITNACKILSEIDNQLEREIYASKLSCDLDIEKSSIMMQIDKLRKKYNNIKMKQQVKNIMQNTSAVRDSINPEKSQNLRAANAEESLIACIVHNPHIVNYVKSKISKDNFSTNFNSRVYQAIIDKISLKGQVDITDLSNDFSIGEISQITRIINSYIKCDNLEKLINEYIGVIVFESNKIDNKSAASADIKDLKTYMDRLKKLKK